MTSFSPLTGILYVRTSEMTEWQQVSATGFSPLTGILYVRTWPEFEEGGIEFLVSVP